VNRKRHSCRAKHITARKYFFRNLQKQQKMEHTTMVETPQYKVEKKEDDFEIRMYGPM